MRISGEGRVLVALSWVSGFALCKMLNVDPNLQHTVIGRYRRATLFLAP